MSAVEHELITRLLSVRQHTKDGARTPHKPLLMLLALGQMAATGSSAMDWSVVEERLGLLLEEFGTSVSTSPAYPFTRLRSDGVWALSRQVDNDSTGQLRAAPIDGRFVPEVEEPLRDPAVRSAAARAILEQQFPMTLIPDIASACGLDLDEVYAVPGVRVAVGRRRDPRWRDLIIAAWDRSCAFCGFDGALRGVPVGIDAAHVRWFNFDGPDESDNGVALCALHHRMLDRGVLGLSDPETVMVSRHFSAVTPAGRSVYDLHGHRLRPRPGTRLPSEDHVAWHRREVFKGEAVA